MPEEALVHLGTQVGIEGQPGSSVPASSRLLATIISPTGVVPVERRKSSGKVSGVVQRLRRHTFAGIVGMLAYHDLAYLLPALLCQEQIDLVPGATQTYRWTFRPQSFGLDVLRAMTVQSGNDDIGVEQFCYGIIEALTLAVTPKDASVQGQMSGRDLLTGLSPSDHTDLACVLVEPPFCSVLVGPDAGSLVRLTRCMEFTLSLSRIRAVLQTLDDALPDYRSDVQQGAGLGVRLLLEHDGTAAGMMLDLRSKAQRVIRLVATGDLIEPGFPYRLQITMPFELLRMTDRGADAELSEFELSGRYDASFGTAIEVLIDLPLASLPVQYPPVSAPVLSAASAWREIDLSWNYVDGATAYAVKRASVSGGPYTTLGVFFANSYSDTGLPDGGTYYYVVTASNSNSSATSNEASAHAIALVAYFRSGDWTGGVSAENVWNNAVDHTAPLQQISAFIPCPSQDGSALNGRKFLTFASEALGWTGAALSLQNWTVWIVAKLNDVSGIVANPIIANASGPANLAFQTDGSVKLSVPGLSVPLTPGAWGLIKWQASSSGPATVSLTVNGTTASTTYATGFLPNQIQLAYDGSVFGAVSIAEVAIGNNLSASDVATIDALLKQRFGL